MVRRKFQVATLAGILAIGSMAAGARAVEPRNFGVGVFNCGWRGCSASSALETLEPHIDMVRIGNVFAYPSTGAANDPNTNTVIANDPFLEEIGEMYGWNRLLLVVNDKNDARRAEIGDLVNDAGTGTLQLTAADFPYIEYIQVYNEPGNFDHLTPPQYVKHLRIAYEWTKGENARRDALNASNGGCASYVPLPHIKIVSAAFYGDDGGYAQTIAAINAGMAQYCDIIAIHDYQGGNVERLAAFRRSVGMNRKPIWVTETGTSDTAKQDRWYEEQMVSMSRAMSRKYKGTEIQPIFQYQLNADDGYGMADFTGNSWHERNTQLWNDLMSRPRTSSPGYRGPARPVFDCSGSGGNGDGNENPGPHGHHADDG